MQKPGERKNSEESRRDQDARLQEKMARIKHKIIVISGKGGVGKSTVSVNLAWGLAVKGRKAGILDVDIHGPNIAKMLGIEGKILTVSEAGIEPVKVISGLGAVSLALLPDNSKPVIWRGPLKMAAIKQFLSDVNWGELDCLVVDSPPGTGDEPLSVCQLIPDISGAVVVTTPQDVAVLDAEKSVLFAKELNVPVLGIIENMSGFACPHCKERIDLFGTGGGEKSALRLDVPFIGRIPLEAEMVKSGDSGQPFISSGKKAFAAEAVAGIIEKISDYIDKR